MQMQAVVVYTPLEAALYNSEFAWPIMVAMFVGLISFVLIYQVGEKVIRKNVRTLRWKCPNALQYLTWGAGLAASVLAVAAFKWVVIA